MSDLRPYLIAIDVDQTRRTTIAVEVEGAASLSEARIIARTIAEKRIADKKFNLELRMRIAKNGDVWNEGDIGSPWVSQQVMLAGDAEPYLTATVADRRIIIGEPPPLLEAIDKVRAKRDS